MYDFENNKMFDKDKTIYILKMGTNYDLMRLEIVYRNGGYYFDTTFEILKTYV